MGWGWGDWEEDVVLVRQAGWQMSCVAGWDGIRWRPFLLTATSCAFPDSFPPILPTAQSSHSGRWPTRLEQGQSALLSAVEDEIHHLWLHLPVCEPGHGMGPVMQEMCKPLGESSGRLRELEHMVLVS